MALTAANTAAAIPSTPLTKEWASNFLATQAATWNGSGITAALTAISNATTNQALVTAPATLTAGAVAGSSYYLKAWGLVTMPASAMPTLAFNAYSGGSAGTALATMTAFTPTASLAAALWDLECWVSFYSTTTAQAIVKAVISSSASTAAASTFLAGNNSATPVTVTSGLTLTLNAVMGSAVASSSFQGIAGYAVQTS